ncbi:hypothetical protein HanXRQr2_Chr14g0621481 [Helianthus annuus]|uniref:Uncharacterized protein n=1 Tax=Helianthus annuus TaxID=4232 RepID=A0A9K3E6B6_HELAN|nr:hypothetical protein HanXRQr2_Chr14g0621481 [Helianthus annuus]KAJ0838585.1 hypothetical protein HanPSC8_Chr14g0596591 [Helianthus annuus]
MSCTKCFSTCTLTPFRYLHCHGYSGESDIKGSLSTLVSLARC